MSTPEQLKGDSLRRQMASSDAYIKEHELELVEMINDAGISAFNGKNAEFGGLSRFLALIKGGKVEPGSYFIVESLDRISRQNIPDAIALLNRIIQSGVKVVTLMDRQVFSKQSTEDNSMQLMMAAITFLRAHQESQHKSLRLAESWKNKRNKARSGVVANQRLPSWLQFSPDKKTIEPVAERVSILGLIFGFSRDGWGAYTIAKELNKRGIPTWGRAKFWQESYVKKLLSNRAVLGEYQPYRLANDASGKRRHPEGEPIPNYYPIVIKNVDFVAVQAAKAGRQKSGRGRKGKLYSNLFTGLLRCKYCKSGIRYSDKGPLPKGGKYLRCSKAVLSRECQSPGFRYEVIEGHLLRLLSGLDFDAILNGPDWLKMTNELRTHRQELIDRLDDLQKEVDHLAASIAESGHSSAILKLLKERESQQQVTIGLKREVDFQLADLTAASRSGHEDLIRQLYSNNVTAEEKYALRRKLADEVRKIVRNIEIGKTFHMPFDFPDDHKLRNANKNVFDDPNNNFELVLVYKNSSVHTFDSLLNENIIYHMGEKLNLFRERHIINDLE